MLHAAGVSMGDDIDRLVGKPLTCRFGAIGDSEARTADYEQAREFRRLASRPPPIDALGRIRDAIREFAWSVRVETGDYLLAAGLVLLAGADHDAIARWVDVGRKRAICPGTASRLTASAQVGGDSNER